MNNKPIKQIKNVQTKTLNFILSAIIIACGINFIVSGIVDYIDNKQGWIYIVIGSILVFLTILVLCIIELIQSRSKTIIECAVTYDEEKKELIEIKGYSFSENLKRYLDAACSESKDIKSVWNKDLLGLNGIINNDKGNTKVSLTQSSALLNQLIVVQSYDAMIGIELKLSWKAFFIKNSEYFEWIDKYIEKLIKHNSFQYFNDSIHWDIVKIIMECNEKEQNK